MGFDAAPPPISVRTTAPTGTSQPAVQPHIELSLEEGKNYAQLASAALINSTIRDTERHHEYELTDIRQQLMTGQIDHPDAEAPLPQATEVPMGQDFSHIENTGAIPGAKFAQSADATLGDLAHMVAVIDSELSQLFEQAGIEAEMVGIG